MRTQHTCTIIMNRNEIRRGLHRQYCQQVKNLNITMTLYISLIQETVSGSNPRPWKRRTSVTTPNFHREQNRKLLKQYSNWSRYYIDNEGQLRRRRYCYTRQIPRGRLLVGALTIVTELLPFCYYISRIEELQQQERKEGEAVEGLSANDYNQQDTRGRIEAFKRLGLTTQTEADIRKYYESEGNVNTDPLHETIQAIKYYTIPELIGLKSKREKKDYKIRAGIRIIRKDMKLKIQREHARHKYTARHKVILPGMSLAA